MKKLLYACVSLMFLSIAGGVAALSGAGALRLLRGSAADEAVKVTPAEKAAPVPQTADEAATVSSAEKAEPAVQTVNEAAKVPPAVQSAERSAPAAQPQSRVYTLDFERIMKDSEPGKAVNRYADKYAAVMAKNVSLLNAALANKKKKYDVPQVKKLIAQYTKQRSDVRTDARSIIRELLRTAIAESPLKDALLIEKANAF